MAYITKAACWMENHPIMSMYCLRYIQGTILGPVMYINNTVENVSSQLKLFVDDCLATYTMWVITTEEDSNALQMDLDTLAYWANTWLIHSGRGNYCYFIIVRFICMSIVQ